MTSVTILVPGHPPTPNHRGHYWQVAKDRAAWKMIAADACLGVRSMSAPVDVLLTFVYANRRRRDPDNQIASAKPLLDGIVSAGVLDDDSNATIRRLMSEEQVDRQARPHVRVTISEVPA